MTDDTSEMIDFQSFVNEDCLDFNQLQEEGLIEVADNYDSEFVPINHPVSLAGVRVNRKGEITLQNDDPHKMNTLRIREMDRSYEKLPNKNNNLHLISKENKMKTGPIYAFDIYRNGTWLKACDFHLST